MNKRILFILFPFFALLFSISGRATAFVPVKKDVVAAFQCAATGGDISTSTPSDLQRSKRQAHKVKIRIKARDASDMMLPTNAERVITHTFFNSITFSERILYSESAEIRGYSLRGPPINNIC